MRDDPIESADWLANWEIQLRKGVLEFLILLALAHREQYGFELIAGIARAGEFQLPEGTLYPLLLRLARDALLTSRLGDGGGGAPRKYYSLTALGRERLAHMRSRWQQLERGVRRLTEEGP